MNNKIIICILVFLTNISAHAKPKIVTSITPLASVISMLTEDSAEIIAVNIAAGCPHHYHAKPSDKNKIMDSDMVIYIDDSFDGFISKMTRDYTGDKIKISHFKTMNFTNSSGNVNWHFWLDLNNVLQLQKELANILSKKFPELEDIIKINLVKAQEKIHLISTVKNDELTNIGELVLLSDSLEHFFKGTDATLVKLYQSSHSSLKSLDNLEKTLSSTNEQCIVININQNIELYKKFGKNIVQLDSENWVVDNAKENDPELFIKKYLEMIKQLKACREA